MITRRQLLKNTGLLAIASGLPISLVGCGQAATVEGYIVKFAPLLINVLEIVAAATGSDTSSLQAKVTKDLADLENLWTAYEANPNATAWEALNDIFTVVENDASTVFDLVHITDPATQAKAMIIVAAAQAIFAILETLFPSAPASLLALKKVAVPTRFAKYLPAGYSSGKSVEFANAQVDKANSALGVKTGNSKVDGLKLQKLPHVGKKHL
jgi:hypothetical protein